MVSNEKKQNEDVGGACEGVTLSSNFVTRGQQK